MKNKIRKLNRGFTIIEVMIVLAIAGLILAIVFIAVPQLQRNTRDNARQDIASRVKAEIETYAANNQGQYPFVSGAVGTTGTIQDFVQRYIFQGAAAATCNAANEKVKTCDPSLAQPVMTAADTNHGLPAGLATGVCTASQAGITHGQFRICYGAKCGGEMLVASGTASTSSKTYAVIIGLDRDGSDYCVDNG